MNLLNPYTEPFIEGYLGINHKTGDDPYGRFFRTRLAGVGHNGAACHVNQFRDKVVVSYVLKDVNDRMAQRRVQDAVKMAEKLMMYTPQCVLARDDRMKVATAITSIGSQGYTSRVILYSAKYPIPYHLNKTTIDYSHERTGFTGWKVSNCCNR